MSEKSWFIDRKHGKDNADGLTPDTPLKTWGEFLRRTQGVEQDRGLTVVVADLELSEDS